MNTIFDGYKKLNDKQIINQMAILETINLSNVFMFSKNKFKESTIHTIKRLLGTERENPEDKNTYKTKEEQVNELYELLKELSSEMTIVIVTHDVNIISTYATKIACIDNKLYYYGKVQSGNEVLSKIYGYPIAPMSKDKIQSHLEACGEELDD